MSNSVSIVVGSKLTLPYPAPLTLDSDHPEILSVALTRDGAVVEARAAGTAWLTFGLAGDLQARLMVVVVEAEVKPAMTVKR